MWLQNVIKIFTHVNGYWRDGNIYFITQQQLTVNYKDNDLVRFLGIPNVTQRCLTLQRECYSIAVDIACYIVRAHIQTLTQA